MVDIDNDLMVELFDDIPAKDSDWNDVVIQKSIGKFCITDLLRARWWRTEELNRATNLIARIDSKIQKITDIQNNTPAA